MMGKKALLKCEITEKKILSNFYHFKNLYIYI